MILKINPMQYEVGIIWIWIVELILNIYEKSWRTYWKNLRAIFQQNLREEILNIKIFSIGTTNILRKNF